LRRTARRPIGSRARKQKVSVENQFNLLSYSSALYFAVYEYYRTDSVDIMYQILEPIMTNEELLPKIRFFFLPVGFDKFDYKMMKMILSNVINICGEKADEIVKLFAKLVAVPTRYIDHKNASEISKKILEIYESLVGDKS